MATDSNLGSLDFLKGGPSKPVSDQTPSSSNEMQLPQDVVDAVMRIPGIDGVWIERGADKTHVVVLHYTTPGPTDHLPRTVFGLTTRIVGGEPIRAGL